MAITSFDPGLIGATKQGVTWVRTGTRTTVAAAWFGMLDVAGNPGSGTLAGTSTTAGVVPTDATGGMPVINAFGGGATGYLATVDFGNTVACRLRTSDMLFKAGAYAFNANTALTAQPSYSGRLPGTDYKDTQLWVEAVTAFTGNPTFTITYTNQDGTGSRTATLAAGLAPTLGRRLQIPLQSGDTGIQKIDNVQCTVATVGTFNVLVLRPLWTGRVRLANDGDMHGPDRTMLPEVYADSALDTMISTDSTSSGVPEIEFTIANG
jgi:hypothetical protein